MSAELYKVRATSGPFRFIPGTMTPAPKDYRRVVESVEMSLADANAKCAEWAGCVESPGWVFEVVPARGRAEAKA